MPLPQSVHSSTQALMLRTSSSVYLAIVNADLSSASLCPGSGHCARGVGAAVGAAVGLTVGLAAGARVGVEVGLAVGLGVGPELCGDAEGGSVVGARVGAEVVRGWAGEAVGERVGAAVVGIEVGGGRAPRHHGAVGGAARGKREIG